MKSPGAWRLALRRSLELPPLAWLARVEWPEVVVDCGPSVRVAEDGLFEGTWAGDPSPASATRSTTVFGSGLFVDGDRLTVVPPSHTAEGIWYVTRGPRLVISNSVVALLVAAAIELDPQEQYPLRLRPLANLKWMLEDPLTGMLLGSHFSIPTLGGPVEAIYYENLVIGRDGIAHPTAKPREAPFESYGDYRGRLEAAMRSALDNSPGYAPLVAVSSGYDSTAVAAVAAGLGCKRAITFHNARGSNESLPDVPDSGESTARALGMSVELADRMNYLGRHDLPEAEFLATGASGEDVIFSAFEASLRRGVLFSGFWAGWIWHPTGRPTRPDLPPGDFGSADLGEFRLRTDFVHIPLPYFGTLQSGPSRAIGLQPDMQAYRLGVPYDRPIPRRLAEEAGVPRGTFAHQKRASATMIQREGERLFAPATVVAIKRFAAEENRDLVLRRRRMTPRRDRALISIAHRLRVPWLAGPLEERRRRLVHFEPRTGTLIWRWAVSVVAPRYSAIAPPSLPNEVSAEGERSSPG